MVMSLSSSSAPPRRLLPRNRRLAGALEPISRALAGVSEAAALGFRAEVEAAEGELLSLLPPFPAVSSSSSAARRRPLPPSVSSLRAAAARFASAVSEAASRALERAGAERAASLARGIVADAAAAGCAEEEGRGTLWGVV